MWHYIDNQWTFIKSFFTELQSDGTYKGSIKNLCAFIAYMAFYIAIVKDVIVSHDFPQINGYWVSLLLGIAGVKTVGTVASKLIDKADTKQQ
jgi:hypothetical protein